jgi:hypothetical protein
MRAAVAVRAESALDGPEDGVGAAGDSDGDSAADVDFDHVARQELALYDLRAAMVEFGSPLYSAGDV